MEVKISLIMPNLNGAKTIKEAILSAVNNKYHNKELIIIDGKSTDESHNIIQEYTKKYNFIKWINVKDNGISDAINIGLDEANGDIIGYLGSDDLLNTETLFKINATKSVVDFDAIYFDSYTYYTSYNIIRLRKCPNVAFNRENLIKYGTLVGLQNIFFSRKIFNKIRYDINNKYSMDYEIYFRILGGGYSNFVYYEYPATINKFDNNISNKMVRQQLREANIVLLRELKFTDYKFFCGRGFFHIIKRIIRHI